MHMRSTYAYMPSKTIYVSELDLPLFEEATRLAGGLSPAVTAALKLYVQRKGRPPMPATDIIELDVADGPITRRKRFRGRKLVSLTQRHDLRKIRYTAYATAKDQYAVHALDEPDWSRMAPDDTATWTDPRTWGDDFYADRDGALHIFTDLDAMRGHLPDDVVTAIHDAVSRPAVEDLDI
jgi:EXLDI family protein